MKTCLSYRDPLFATYHYLASHGVVAQENPTGIRWFFNHAVGLSCSGAFQKGYSSPKLSVFPYGVLADGNLDTYIVNICFSPEDSLKIIKRMIDAGYYVLFDHVDDYYLDGKSFFGERHFYHDGLILGYDEGADTFVLAAYDIGWNYGVWETPMPSFLKGVLSAASEGEHPRLVAARSKPDPVALDLPRIADAFRTYLGAEPFSEENQEMISGISVHDALIRYLELLDAGEIPHEKMDWRIMRLLWEQKKCVLGCLEDIEKTLLQETTLSCAYRSITEMSNLLRIQYALYHRKQQKNLVPVMSEKLKKIKENEAILLPKLTEKMKERGY